MRRPFGALALAALLVSLACSSGGEGNSDGADTLTTRQRDSIIGESTLPGAQGVRGAMRAADSAAARLERLDSIGRP